MKAYLETDGPIPLNELGVTDCFVKPKESQDIFMRVKVPGLARHGDPAKSNELPVLNFGTGEVFLHDANISVIQIYRVMLRDENG